MITDTERREVAQNLKHFAHDQLQGGLLNTLKVATGVDGTWRGVLLRLAGLIDPGDGQNEPDMSVDSGCGTRVDRDALLEIAQAMESRGKVASEVNGGDGEVDAWWLRQYAHLIREALGVDDGW